MVQRFYVVAVAYTLAVGRQAEKSYNTDQRVFNRALVKA